MSNKEKKCKYTSIGGQAVIEGVMMNGPERTVLAVRKNTGEIVTEDVKKPNYKAICPIFKIPVIRGVVAYIESMVMGYSTLMRSADLSGMTELDELQPDEKTQEQENIENDGSDKTNKLSDTVMSVIMIVASVIGVMLALFLFMFIPTVIFNYFDGLTNSLLSNSNLRGLIEGVMKLMIFVVYVLLVSQMKDIKRLFQYHGAEHKTIFCYEAKLDLTVENVRKQKRFHPRCGTSFLFLMIAVSIILTTLVAFFFPQFTKMTIIWVIIKILLIPIFCGVGYELLKICGRYDNVFTKIIAAPGLWIQRLTTKEPDDDMIEVAIKSMVEVIPENAEKTADCCKAE